MDKILDKAKRGLSEGFDRILRKYYDGQEEEPAKAEAAPVAVKTQDSAERAIEEAPRSAEPKPFPPVTWYILRYEYLKGGARVAMVVIKHGSIKEEYVATEWLKKVSPDPVLGCFITAVVNAVKPDEGLEAILADYTS